MNAQLLNIGCDGFRGGLPPEYTSKVFSNARVLQRNALTGLVPPLLRGRNFALLYTSETDAPQALFQLAVTELGAQVAHVHLDLSDLAVPQDVQKIAYMLGRLYDAVECLGLPSDYVRQLAYGAGVPVFDGLSSPMHPTAGIAACLGDDNPEADKRRFVLQAVLLHAMDMEL